MKAVMYGAGNIGRGFIGALLSDAGYDVSFVDVAEPLIHALNERKSYPVRILANEGHRDVQVNRVSAIDGNDREKTARAIATADLMATAVGVNVLKHIVPNLVAGIRQRFQTTDAPLNIIICENLIDADKLLAGMIKEQLTEAERTLFDARIGMVEASIGRMVPVQTDEMKDGDPLRVCVERYAFLPVDKDAWKGDIPAIEGLVPSTPFGFFIQRKLYVHNMGHCLCAYLGQLTGCRYIYETMEDANAVLLIKNAMLESMEALALEYGVNPLAILAHIDDLLTRFQNRALGDTCERVGNDQVRKLAPTDRLVGAARLCEKHGIVPHHIVIGIAAGLHRYLLNHCLPQTMENATEALVKLSAIDGQEPLAVRVLDAYALFMQGTSTKKLYQHAQRAMALEAADVL